MRSVLTTVPRPPWATPLMYALQSIFCFPCLHPEPESLKFLLDCKTSGFGNFTFSGNYLPGVMTESRENDNFDDCLYVMQSFLFQLFLRLPFQVYPVPNMH